MTKTATAHEETVEWLSNYIRKNQNPDITFRNLKSVLRSEGNNRVYFHIFNNRYLLGSFIKEAQKNVSEWIQ